MKKTIITSLILSGGLLIASQGVGQIEAEDQPLQRERFERSDERVNPTADNPGAGGRDFGIQEEGATEEQQSEFFSGTDQRRFEETDRERLDRQQSPQQQPPLQEEFGVSPRFDERGGIDRERQTESSTDNLPGGSSDMTRGRASEGRSGSGMSPGPGSSGGSSGLGGGGGGQGGGGGGGGQ